MEGILLDTMFDLPSLEGVEEVVISREWRAPHGRSTSTLLAPATRARARRRASLAARRRGAACVYHRAVFEVRASRNSVGLVSADTRSHFQPCFANFKVLASARCCCGRRECPVRSLRLCQIELSVHTPLGILINYSLACREMRKCAR
jgi:hypothetical protein